MSAEPCRVIRGDCLDVLDELGREGGAFDCVIADPPYCSGGMSKTERRRKTSCKYVSGNGGDFIEFEGDARSDRAFVLWCSEWMRRAYGLTILGGSLFCFTDWRQVGNIVTAAEVAGWLPRGVMAWHKPNHRTRPGLTQACEFVVWCEKGAPSTAKDAGVHYVPGYYRESAPTGARRSHITQKPVGVFSHLLSAVKTPQDGRALRVLDPFAGSGACGVACVGFGAEYVGIELSEHYAATAAEAIGRAQAEAAASEA